tara:strand:+ start:4373 stop:4963 length:591 start_codon:yes stop_codon:yes gene_type:complete
MKNIKNFFTSYVEDILSVVKEYDQKKLNNIYSEIEKVILKKKKIFVCGNGGSAATANHFICDYLKLIKTNTKLKPKIISLSNNIETITAISNDIDYSEIFVHQAESLFERGDLFILLSVSGNSKNVVKLATWCKKKKIKCINLVGFDGGKLKKLSKLTLISNVYNYGKAEDCNHIFMHSLMQFLINKHKIRKKIRI